MLLLACFLAACKSAPITSPHLTTRGEFAQAREDIAKTLPEKRSDRRYLLDRMRLGVMTLADGYPQAAQPIFEEVYDVLRTQGINRGKETGSVLLNEDIKFWKGEPFEQALGFFYYGTQQAMLGHWDNTRAAAGNSLFQLRRFEGEKDAPINTAEVERNAAEHENPSAATKPGETVDHGYAPRQSNFVLGYLLNGIANQQLGRVDEANDNFNAALSYNPRLGQLVNDLRTGQYNTILLVAYGLGPEKVAYGSDNSRAAFEARTASDNREIAVQFAGGRRSYAWALDVNEMANDHFWNQFAGVRKGKSDVGNLLLIGGLGALGGGAAAESSEAMIAGAAAAAAGAFLKAGAHADTLYSDAFPQRVYVVPLQITKANATVELHLDSTPATRLVLAGLAPPESGVSGGAQLRYATLLGGGYESGPPPEWATSGRINYDNDITGSVNPGNHREVPFILGGTSVRQPSARAVQAYNQSGVLVTPAELEQMYRDEGIRWHVDGESTDIRHVLEGGNSLVPPLAGTTGFARVFGQVHPAYQPKSQHVRDLAEQAKVAAPQPQLTPR